MSVVDNGFIKLPYGFCFGAAMEAETQVSNESFYQRGLERFYDDLIDVFWRNHFGFWTEACSELNEPYIPRPDVELLTCLIERGWKIIMNFVAPDCILGNIAVKLGDKWFAIGECRRDKDCIPYVAQIWPLKYILPHASTKWK